MDKPKIKFKNGECGDWPCGLVVEFGMLCFGGQGLVPGRRPAPLVGSHSEVVTHIQNRGRLVQMLAQGESSSAEKKKKETIMFILSMLKRRLGFRGKKI